MTQAKFPPIYKIVKEQDKPTKIKKINEYLLIDKLGTGYFSKVYLAMIQNKKSDNYYAAKAIRIHENYHNSKIFEREIKILRLLKHPNIVQLHTVLYAPSTNMAYIIMEWANCGTLQRAIINETVFNERTIASIFLQIALALSYLHSKGIVHRDVKPSNILLFSNGTAKLADFGISHFEESAESVCGTPSYQAPDLFEGVHCESFEFFSDSEKNDTFDQKIIDLQRSDKGKTNEIINSSPNLNTQVTNNEDEKNNNYRDNTHEKTKHKAALDDSIINEWKIDPKKSDIWSLGISMYQTAYGVLPYDGHNVYEIVNKINNNPLIIPQKKDRQYSLLFVDLIKKMLKIKSSERLSIEEVINHPFFIRYQNNFVDKPNFDEINSNQNSIFINKKRFMKKIPFDIKPINPPKYSNEKIVKIDAIICPENYTFCTKAKKVSSYSFYRYTFID